MLDQVYKRHQVAPGLYHLVRLSPAEGHALALWLAREKATAGGFSPSDREYAPGHFGLPGEPLLEVTPAEFGEGSRERFAQEVAVRGVRIYERSPLSLKDWREILPKGLGRLLDLPTVLPGCSDVLLQHGHRLLWDVPKTACLQQIPGIPEGVYMASLKRVAGPEARFRNFWDDRTLGDGLFIWQVKNQPQDLRTVDPQEWQQAWEWGKVNGPADANLWSLLSRGPEALDIPAAMEDLRRAFGATGRSWMAVMATVLGDKADAEYAAAWEGAIVRLELKANGWSSLSRTTHPVLDFLRIAGFLEILLVDKDEADDQNIIARVVRPANNQVLSLLRRPSERLKVRVEVIC